MAKNRQSRQVKKKPTARSRAIKRTNLLKGRFLEQFVKCCVVGKAARLAGVSRSQVYKWLETDSRFAAGYEDARREVVEMLETEAVRRAVEGVKKPVGFYQGRSITTVKEYSDTLLIVLLKAHAPEKYHEKHEISGPGGRPIPI